MPTKTILDLPISLGGAATTGATGRRQIENFIFLTPGVTGTQWQKSINGSPGFSQEVLIDGVDMQNIGAPGFIAEASPPYRSVEEFKVQEHDVPGGIRRRLRRHEFHAQVRDQPLPRRSVRVPPQRQVRLRGFFARSKSICARTSSDTFNGPRATEAL
jgi:hypothetical protein